MPQERIFVMQKGTEFPESFAGTTVPYTVPANNEEMIAEGGPNAYKIFAQALALIKQKVAKAAAAKDGATVESIRKAVADYKIGDVRVRGSGTGPKKVKGTTVAAALGDDFRASLPEALRAEYDRRLAALNEQAKPAPKAAPATPPAAAPKSAPAKGGRK